MKNKKTVLIASGIIALVLITISIGYFNETKKDNVTIKEKSKITNHGAPAVPVIEIEEKRKEPIEIEFISLMEEYQVRNAIHGMSHQKVRAADKWGFLPMTQERVERLIEVVEMNKSSYDNDELYLDILNRWANNDFSRADKDHNAIWTLQGGNVGRATGVLTFEEEKEFIKKYFNIEVIDVTSD
ncbi:hypothetical protein JSQ81_02950 [Sporosarcina sp. Marseille-Q4063]|uniref:DUF6241 domain-containing protein n=1 Tax=Sporosarcina sp. Marseille-Q4063 TaxID=2810514 RepID=UPI001BB0AB9C|nr:DUF6241 domain-containing protein [Sporosarcina sp. Marseille-Q4063]QUW22561.1 hypothetical protein JSQ81_02950 [Sporosarcina sp. Marseille-Q4063]